MPDSISDRLRELQAGMSARKFASLLGMKTTTLWEYLHGREPPASTVVLICRKMNVRVWWLLTGEGPKYGRDADGSSEASLRDELQDLTNRLNLLVARMDETEVPDKRKRKA